MSVEDAGATSASQPARPVNNEPYTVVVDSSMDGMPAAAIAYFRGYNRGTAEVIGTPDSEHITRSKEEILETARTALEGVPNDRSGRAIVLGAGNCLDIPLEDLADDERLGKITLVDIDQGGVEAAVKKLPPDKQEKITIVAADITGVLAELTNEVEALVSQEDISLASFFNGITSFINALDVSGRYPDLGHDYVFVCSQIVMGPLRHIPERFIEAAFRRMTEVVTPRGLDITLFGEYTQNLVQALDGLSRRLQVEHINFLSQLASLSGATHLADTYRMFTSADEYSRPTPIIVPEAIDPVIAEHFTTLRPEQHWRWELAGTGQRFDVVSNALQRKPQEVSTAN